ncbi:MAG: inorganic phosphate transporter [Clostridia bacterium]|nr:inorganic phosphate transporter [Clostridia bacterium]
MEQLFSFSSLTITSLILTLGVVFVNGLTDAPNAIATCVTTRCLSVGKAVLLSAIFNFLGVLISGRVGATVTETVMNMVDFGADENLSIIALSAAMFAIVLWAVLAWYFGIPTSESHALIAGLTGSALCVSGSLQGVNLGEWLKTIYGLFVSCFGGFICGYLICRIIIIIFRNVKRQQAELVFKYGQIFAAILMSLMHGAQDGQKFMAVLMLCTGSGGEGEKIPPTVILLCSLIMALGTMSGGKKIIKAVGVDMVKLQRYQGFGADLSGALSLLVSTCLGLPVSTTHAKTTAMMGAACVNGSRGVNPLVIKDMAMAWIFTFPGCGFLGFVLTRVFMGLFNS